MREGTLDYPLTLPALAEFCAHRFGDKPAIRDGEISLDYGHLDDLRRQAAKAFLAAGIERGDRIAVWAPNSYRWIIAALAMQTIGAVLVPLPGRLTGAEAADIIERSGSRLLLTAIDMPAGNPLAMLANYNLPGLQQCLLIDGDLQLANSWPSFLESAQSVSEPQLQARAASVQPGDIMDMLFTSGTTGKPKGVLCSHEQNLRVFKTWANTVGLRSDDRYLIVSPFFHSFGYKAGWLAAFMTGSCIYPVAAFDRQAVMAQIERDKISVFPGAPALYEMLLNHPRRQGFDLSSLRLAVTGAAPITVSLIEALKQTLGFDVVVTAYGLTEASGVVTMCQPEDSHQLIAETSGRAIAGVEVKCVDPATLRPLRAREEGEIWVRGFSVMRGYFDMPQASREAITREGWLRTGDIGVLDDEGYLKITGRLKDMYIMNGENVYPAEVENVIAALPGVAQVAVLGVEQQPQGEVGIACVVLSLGSHLSSGDLQAHCRENLAAYKVPAQVVFMDNLPMNATGKVMKPALRQRLETSTA